MEGDGEGAGIMLVCLVPYSIVLLLFAASAMSVNGKRPVFLAFILLRRVRLHRQGLIEQFETSHTVLLKAIKYLRYRLATKSGKPGGTGLYVHLPCHIGSVFERFLEHIVFSNVFVFGISKTHQAVKNTTHEKSSKMLAL